MRGCRKSLRTGSVPVLDKEERDDLTLDNAIAKLGLAEYQVNKLHRFLAGRLDKSNPNAFSKGSSTHGFECRGREYRVTIDVDIFETKDKSILRSFINAVQSPPFIIMSILCSVIICLLSLVSADWSSPMLETFSDDELERQYSLILDRCSILINGDRPNPRSSGALYSTCNKAIVQLEGFCEEHHIAVCKDKRIELYLTRNKLRT